MFFLANALAAAFCTSVSSLLRLLSTKCCYCGYFVSPHAAHGSLLFPSLQEVYTLKQELERAMMERDEMKARLSELGRLRRGTETSLNNSDQSLASLDMAARPLHGSDLTSDISVR